MKDTALIVHKEIEIEAPPERVWLYVATQDGYTRWSCTVAEVYEVVLEERLGGRYRERGVSRGMEWTNVGRVVAYEPPRRFTFTFQTARADGTYSTEMTVTIQLIDLGGRTRVVLEHTGIDQLPPERRDASFRSFDQGWAAALQDLFDILVRDVLPQLGHLLIHQTIEIEAPADRVWRYLATEEGRREHLRLRYPPEHMQSERFEARAGGAWESAGVSAASGDPYHQFGQILSYDPPRLLVFTLQEEGWPAETLVTYRLSEYRGKTRVTLIHSGFERLPAERRERTRKAYEIGRFKGLERLRDLIEGREVEIQYPITIRKEIELDAPVDRVWQFVGTEEGSRRRHTVESIPGTMEYQDEILEPGVGGRYQLRGRFHGRPFEITGRVVAYDPPRLLALTWREADWPVDTLVTFRLAEAAPGKTHLVVIHNGFEHLPREIRTRTAGEYEEGRERGLNTLKRLLSEWVILKEIEIEALPERIWSVVATQDGMRRWWDAPALTLETHAGGHLDSRGVHDGTPYHHIGVVQVYDPPRRFVFTLREDMADGRYWPEDSVVTVTLHDCGDRTWVVVDHDFSRLPEGLRDRLVKAYRGGWTDALMEHLRALALDVSRT